MVRRMNDLLTRLFENEIDIEIAANCYSTRSADSRT